MGCWLQGLGIYLQLKSYKGLGFIYISNYVIGSDGVSYTELHVKDLFIAVTDTNMNHKLTWL